MFAITDTFKFFTSMLPTRRYPDLHVQGNVPRVSNDVLLSEDDIQDVQVNLMSKVDLMKLIQPMPGAYVTDDFDIKNYPEVMQRIERLIPTPIKTIPRLEIVDSQAYMARPTNCLRSRVVALLRLLEDDIRCIENTRGLEMYKAKNPLNDLVMRDHKALYKTLKEIKAKGGKVLEDFHSAIDNLGYWGGYKKDERVIRIHHPNIPYGYIEV